MLFGCNFKIIKTSLHDDNGKPPLKFVHVHCGFHGCDPAFSMSQESLKKMMSSSFQFWLRVLAALAVLVVAGWRTMQGWCRHDRSVNRSVCSRSNHGGFAASSENRPRPAHRLQSLCYAGVWIWSFPINKFGVSCQNKLNVFDIFTVELIVVFIGALLCASKFTWKMSLRMVIRSSVMKQITFKFILGHSLREIVQTCLWW